MATKVTITVDYRKYAERVLGQLADILETKEPALTKLDNIERLIDDVKWERE